MKNSDKFQKCAPKDEKKITNLKSVLIKIPTNWKSVEIKIHTNWKSVQIKIYTTEKMYR